MVQIEAVSSTSGSSHESHYLNNTYDTSDRIIFGDQGWFDVDLFNPTSTNVTVSIWCEDTSGNGVLGDVATFKIEGNGEIFVQVSGFPAQADGSAMHDTYCHLLLHNDDNESSGVEISTYFYY